LSAHRAIIEWERGQQDFTDGKYGRGHRWTFDGGATVPASSSPAVVPVPYSDAAGVDPEEAYVAALSSCHMLWFLDLAARQGYRVDRYRDEAAGHMARDERGKSWIDRVELRPHVVFSGTRLPDPAAAAQLHHVAHEKCFIANSVRSQVDVQPSFEWPPAS